MIRKQVFISDRMAKEIEMKAQQENRSESAILRSLLSCSLSNAPMNLDMPTTIPFAMKQIEGMGARQLAVLKFVLKSTLLIRNYTGRTMLEVLPENTASLELEDLQKSTEQTYQQLIEEIDK